MPDALGLGERILGFDVQPHGVRERYMGRKALLHIELGLRFAYFDFDYFE